MEPTIFEIQLLPPTPPAAVGFSPSFLDSSLRLESVVAVTAAETAAAVKGGDGAPPPEEEILGKLGGGCVD